MAKLRQLAIKVFIDGVETSLELLIGLLANRIVRRVVVDVG